jgi:hypothetical protein
VSGETRAPDPRDRRIRRRLRLRRADGRIYLDRWGLSHPRIGGVLLHRMSAPDPGGDLHDHPWTFVTIVLWGGYTEQRVDTRTAPVRAEMADRRPDLHARGRTQRVHPFRPRMMRLDEAHTITTLTRRTSWSLVINGPRRRTWGFYMPEGWVDYRTYDDTVRAERRDLYAEGTTSQGSPLIGSPEGGQS